MRIEMDNDIGTFAIAMESQMKKHQKKKGNSWKWVNIKFLEDKLDEEYAEWKKSGDKHELVDIANICMMLFNRKLWEINNIKIEPE